MQKRGSIRVYNSPRRITFEELWDGVAIKIARRALRKLNKGRLRVVLPSGRSFVTGEFSKSHADANLNLHSYAMIRKAIARGTVGFAESYMAGDFTTTDLGQVFHFFLDNQQEFARAGRGFFKVRLPDIVKHQLKRNTRSGSRRNISYHYDLGNDFFAHWLDQTMTYSSGIYPNAACTLEEAQVEKHGRILSALGVKPGDRVLEIGCGWGSMAERIAESGAKCVAITLSQEQLAFTQARLRRAGLGDLVDVRLVDYRDVEGEFDHIISIEMIEAVGKAYWQDYFDVLAQRLKPGGTALLQAITIHPNEFDAYQAKPDFIQRYIFPGGMLPTQDIMSSHSAKAGLNFQVIETFGDSYVRTLRAWRKRFEAAWPALSAMGYDERFRRMWLYYLTYCEVGFERGTINVGHYKMTKRSPS